MDWGKKNWIGANMRLEGKRSVASTEVEYDRD